MKTRTSQDNPLYLTTVPTDLPGKLCMTLAPGKHAIAKDGTRHARDLATDLDRLKGELGASTVVNLLEDEEMSRLRVPQLVAECERRGMTVLRLPIPDGGVLSEHARVHALVAEIRRRLERGETVVVHCAGGLGRAGTIVGCVLVELGVPSDDALATLASRRSPRSPETEAQRRFVIEHAARSSKVDRFVGCVLGGAIGDAMGAPTEFLDMAGIRAKYGPDGVRGFVEPSERDGRRVAQYTDDTQLAEVVARALLDAPEGELDLAMRALARRIVEWRRAPEGGHRAPGNACLAGAAALERGAPWSEAGGPRAGGCGSVMRVHPVGLYIHADLSRAEAWAVAQSKLTHRDPIALAACAAMAAGVALNVRGEPVDRVCEEMIAAARRHDVKTADMMARALEEAHAMVPPSVTLDRLRGWAAHEAIAATIYLFARHPEDPREAILEGANTPGDSDSLASMAGALVGARAGISALPAEWVRDVERSSELRALALELARRSAPRAEEGELRERRDDRGLGA